jgi:hypothetical protein
MPEFLILSIPANPKAEAGVNTPPETAHLFFSLISYFSKSSAKQSPHSANIYAVALYPGSPFACTFPLSFTDFLSGLE